MMTSMMEKMNTDRYRRLLYSASLFSLLLLMLMVGGCSGNAPRDFNAVAADGTLSQGQKVEEILGGMSLEEKVGQMIFVGITGTEVDATVRDMFARYHFGGVVEFDRNLQSVEQIMVLNNGLQRTTYGRLPLFIAIDEEGGQVARMRDVLPPPPAQLTIGQTGRPELAREWATNISGSLKAMGFNLNFAPVADLGSFKDRHYSTDPKVAADFVSAAASGYEESGMLYTLKHFPGIGRGKTDTHLDTVVVDASPELLNSTDVVPFARVIRENSNDKQMIMVSHVIYSGMGVQKPASLSPEIMTRLLRDQLGYQGVVITDDLAMGAVSRYYTPGEAAVASVMAGVDMVMSCHIYKNQEETAKALLEAVKTGKISEERINESLRRIIRAKLNLAPPKRELIVKRSLAA